jgi:hypothetical protein
MSKFLLYLVGIILLLIITWATIPYVLGVTIMLIVAVQIIKLTGKTSWNS